MKEKGQVLPVLRVEQLFQMIAVTSLQPIPLIFCLQLFLPILYKITFCFYSFLFYFSFYPYSRPLPGIFKIAIGNIKL